MFDKTTEDISVQIQETIPFDCCPITKKRFRHPVIASDGYCYELIALLNRVNDGELISPVTKKKITYIHYDILLKKEIDEDSLQFEQDVAATTQETIQSQYPDYDKQEYLEQLTQILTSPYIAWKQSIYKSSITALGMLLTVCYISENQDEISPSLLLSTMLLSGLADFCIRMSSSHKYGLFGGVKQAIKTAVDIAPDVWDTLDSIDPEELHW